MRKEKEVHVQRFPIVQIDRSICYSPSLHYLEHIVDCGNVGVGIIQDSGFFIYCGFPARTEGVLGFEFGLAPGIRSSSSSSGKIFASLVVYRAL